MSVAKRQAAAYTTAKVGQIERRTQDRVVKLFKDTLGYTYLGRWNERQDSSNIEAGALRAFLKSQKIKSELADRAIYLFQKEAGDLSKTLYDRNKAVYEMLRYGVKVRPEIGENTETVWLIDWKTPENNHFAIAEEVTVAASDPKASGKRPDIVLYVNGIALGVIELKRSTVSVAEGIRQNLASQKKTFIEHFFSTVQFVMAGNDTEGMRYGCIETPERYYLTWKQESATDNLLDRQITQVCEKSRFLELIHDFIVYDGGVKKLCRPNQYFGVRAAADHVRRREGGIIWHTQGSGKSLTMVWLAKWLRENRADARVLIITDRKELDEQIEMVFEGVNENIYRTTSGGDLIAKLNDTTPWLVCSLIHKFGRKEGGEEVGNIAAYVEEVKNALPKNFQAKGDLYVFVDECHRTQSGELHEAMKAILPSALFIGFTGTPLLRADKQKSIEIFGPYIHTYKFDEAVEDGVVLDLRYEARDIDQHITSQAKIDHWFDAKTKGLTDLARAQLKQKWGTMQRVLSSHSRLQNIVSDILFDMSTKPRLMDGHGNALLVSGSIYEACRFYDLFSKTELAGKCAIVTSYVPAIADIKGEETGAGVTDTQDKYETYRNMLASWFGEDADKAVTRVTEFEKKVKEKFIKQPGQMKLLIVVDKLLTGFDAPSATYLYIDKQMQDHGLFQAICRVNRLDGDSKEYGYIVDYKDLFKSLESAINDYTVNALSGYDKDDIQGLLKDRLATGRERLDEALEAVKALCEFVDAPLDTAAYIRYFCAAGSGDAEQLKDNEPKRLTLYHLTASLLRAFAAVANEMSEAGYNESEMAAVRADVAHYEQVRNEVKLASGDYIDLKMYEPAMRHLIDTYIRSDDSEKISTFDDMSLIQLILERGVGAFDALPENIKQNQAAVAETIENNVRKLIIDETPINPSYYKNMSELLDALIKQRKAGALEYQAYLAKAAELAQKVANPGVEANYPSALNTRAKRAIFDNLGRDEDLALRVDSIVRQYKQDDFRGNPIKERKLKYAIKEVVGQDELAESLLELVKIKVTTEEFQLVVDGISVDVVRKDIKNLHLGVYPPRGRVRVAAPLLVNDDAVRLAVIGKLTWIKRQQARFEAQPRQSEREMVSGESHYYLGRRYRLRVVPTDGPGRVVVKSVSTIELYVRPSTTANERLHVLQNWYRRQLKEIIPGLLAKWQPIVGVSVGTWGIRRMKTKWGTCNIEARRIWLNLELVKQPLPCLEYVIVHELTHLIQRHHDSRFVAILDRHMPDWRQWRSSLNSSPLANVEWLQD